MDRDERVVQRNERLARSTTTTSRRSASAARDAYIVSSRNLDTIWALARNGSGALFAVSSSMNRSDFAFARPIDKFYQPHSVLQLASGNLLVIDDGAQRPSTRARPTRAARTPRTARAASRRAVEYKLDFMRKTVSVVWQFEFPFGLDEASIEKVELHDVFNAVGGSVYELTNTLVHFLVSLHESVSRHARVQPARDELRVRARDGRRRRRARARASPSRRACSSRRRQSSRPSQCRRRYRFDRRARRACSASGV